MPAGLTVSVSTHGCAQEGEQLWKKLFHGGTANSPGFSSVTATEQPKMTSHVPPSTIPPCPRKAAGAVPSEEHSFAALSPGAGDGASLPGQTLSEAGGWLILPTAPGAHLALCRAAIDPCQAGAEKSNCQAGPHPARLAHSQACVNHVTLGGRNTKGDKAHGRWALSTMGIGQSTVTRLVVWRPGVLPPGDLLQCVSSGPTPTLTSLHWVGAPRIWIF